MIEDAKPCRRCGIEVVKVKTGDPGPIITAEVDAEPLAIGQPSTPPYFEQRNGELREKWKPTPRGYPVHAVHHCRPPALCRWCNQRHTTDFRQPAGNPTEKAKERATQ
jgi:hypothetical protein